MRRKETEMYCFTCKEDFESMMTCIYRVLEAKKGSQNVRLEIEPVEQMDLLTEYVHVEVDPELAHKVVRSIRTKISAKAYYQVYLAAMSNDPGRLDDIYRFLRIGFAVGGKVTECLREESVMQIFELSRQVSNERHFFREFLRFTRIEPGIYVAHMEPKGNVVALVAGHFADRMPSEDWMIIDDGRGLGVIHPKNEPFYVTKFREEEMERLCQTEQQEDLYTQMWKEFFYTIAVEKRKNPGCQRNMFPLRYRKHVTEFL